jgi:signal transduction histidine kinase
MFFLIAKENTELTTNISFALDQANNGLKELRKTIHEVNNNQHLNINLIKMIYRLKTTIEYTTKISITFNHNNTPCTIGKHNDEIAYRVIQESLTNSIRHGKATNVHIYAGIENNGVRFIIQDNGVGFSELKEGFGIKGMRERIYHAGGRIEIKSKHRHGTMTSFWLPTE